MKKRLSILLIRLIAGIYRYASSTAVGRKSAKAFIGRALVQNTSVIILDEPTTHLDEKNKTIVLTTLRMLAKEYHKTILFSSHDWRLAKEFSDKIWYIKEGDYILVLLRIYCLCIRS